MMAEQVANGDGWEVVAGSTCGADGATRSTIFFWRTRVVLGTSGRGTTDAQAANETAVALRALARAATEAADALEKQNGQQPHNVQGV